MSSIYEWQDQFVADFILKMQTQDVYTLTACPGAGKTRGALRAAKKLMKAGVIQRIVICAHNEQICKQWRSAGVKEGVKIYIGWRTDHGEQGDFDGFAVTYQSLPTNIEGHRALCSRYRILLIVDEAHHVGKDLPWDSGMNRAFDGVSKTLVISGTPFRHDGRLPAFIEHTRSENGDLMSKVDFPYSYGRGIEDGICREIYFPHFDGDADWLSHDGKRQSAKISDDLTGRLESERNRAALDAKGDWIRSVFAEANAKLSECREAGHPAAGGLILATDRTEARRFEMALREVTGEIAVVVVSDEPGAARRIDQFRASTDRWVIAVKMINEGVDIPRLRVLVYATICQTELHFLQAMGRIVRAGDDDDKFLAYAFLPHRKEFLEYAARMRAERDAAIKEKQKRRKPIDLDTGGGDDQPPSMFQPLGSSAIPMGVLGINGNMPPEVMQYAASYKQAHGLKHPVEVIAEIMRPTLGAAVTVAEPQPMAPPEPAPVSQQERNKRLRDEINDEIGRQVKSGSAPFNYEEYHIEWMRRGGGRQPKADQNELERKLAWVKSLRR